MPRPLILTLVALTSAAAFGLGGGQELPKPKANPEKPLLKKAKWERPQLKAVIHINFADTDRHKHGLKNITNILKEVKGEAEIIVVCHGEGIGLVVKGKSKYAADVDRLVKAKVRFAACENTLRDKAIARDKLLPGVKTVPAGAVEVIRRQQAGFGYFKP